MSRGSTFLSLSPCTFLLLILRSETRCAVTRLPARYRDPLTGLPYANLEAFKVLRERHERKLAGESAADGSDEEGSSDETDGSGIDTPRNPGAATPMTF